MAKQTTDSHSSSTAALEILVENFRHFAKGSLIGFCDLILPAVGLRIDCSVHVTADEHRRMWIGLPSTQKDGKWIRMVEAINGPAHYRFQAVAVKAIQKHLDSLQEPPPTRAKPAGPPPAEFPEDFAP